MATANEALKRPIVQASQKLYLRNNSGTWVDFSAAMARDYLLGLADITHAFAGVHGEAVRKSVSVKVANQDGYWSKTPPSEFTPWEGRYVQLRLKIADVASEINIGTFRIAADGIEVDMSGVAAIRLEPLAETLARIEADDVKQGQEWYRFRPWTFLVSELIRAEFGDPVTGLLPGSYEIPSDPRFTYPDGLKHSSPYGKPPQKDATGNWNADNTEIPYALEYDATSNLLFVAIGKDLWEFDPATDTWTNRGEDASNGNGVAARRIFILNNATRDVVVLKWADSGSSPKTSNFYLNYWNRTNNTWHGTTRLSRSDFFSGTWWIFDGFYETSGTPDFRTRGQDQIAGGNGNNVAVPFPQYVTQNQSGGDTDYTDPLATMTTTWAVASADNPLPDTLQTGYYGLAGAPNVNADLGARVSYGNKPNVACNPDPTGGDDGIIYIVTYDGTNYHVRQINLTKGSAPSAVTMHTGVSEQIHSLTFVREGDLVLIRWVQAGGDTNDATAVYRLSGHSWASPAGSWTAMNSNLSPGMAAVTDFITDVLHANTSFNLAIYVKLKYNRLNKFPMFQVAAYQNVTDTETLIDSSMSYMQSTRLAAGTLPTFYVDTQSGSIKKLSTETGAPTLVDGGRPPVFDAPYAADIWFATGSDPDMWGLSFPFHAPETQLVAPQGKYYLWHYGTKHLGRVELADFTDMTKLEAVSEITTAYRKVAFVDPDGDWIVRDRTPQGAAVGTLARDRLGSGGWTALERLKSTEIVNYVEVTPQESRLGEMKTTLVQRDGSKFDGAVTATQIDTSRRSVRLRCTSGGKISGGETRWDFIGTAQTIRTRLAAAYVSGTSVTVESVWDVATGDIIEVTNSGQRTINAINPTTRVLTIDSAFGTSYPVLSAVEITKANSDKWSSAGVTTLAEALDASETGIDVASAASIGVGNFIIVDDEEMQVTDKVGNTLTVVRGDNAGAHSNGASVACIVKPSGLEVWTRVGPHGINVRFDRRDVAAVEMPIAAGDYLQFVCPGLVIESIDGSLVIASDGTSIAAQKGRRRQRGRIENRFLTPQLAEFWANDVKERGKLPRRRFTATCALDVSFQQRQIVSLKSPELLPSDAGNDIDCIITAVQYSKRATVYELEER